MQQTTHLCHRNHQSQRGVCPQTESLNDRFRPLLKHDHQDVLAAKLRGREGDNTVRREPGLRTPRLQACTLG